MLGCHSHPGPHVARRPWVGHPWYRDALALQQEARVEGLSWREGPERDRKVGNSLEHLENANFILFAALGARSWGRGGGQ